MQNQKSQTTNHKIAMLGYFLVVVVFTLTVAQPIQASIIDSTAGLGQFNYTEGAVASSQYFTSGGNGASGGPTYKAASALTRLKYNTGYGFFPASYKGLNFPVISSSPNKIRTHLISPAVTGASADGTTVNVYMSFLLRVNSAPAAGTRGFISIGANAGSQAQLNKSAWAMVNSAGNVCLAKSSVTAADVGALTATNLVGTGIHLVVLRYSSINLIGSDDVVSLWLDPANSSFGADEASIPTADLSGTGGTDADAIRAVVLANGPASSGGDIDVDEIRLGTTWADVLPTPGPCVAPVVTNNSPTAITTNVNQVVTLSTAITAGDDNGNLPTLQWQQSTNSGSTWANISGAINASYTTPVLTAGDNGSQYRVHASNVCDGSTADSTAVTLTVFSCDNVGITTSPLSGSVPAGYSTNLSVVVTGSLPVFQWQRYDTAGLAFTNIPNANASTYTTPVLLLADNGAQFRCHVTSGCNASTADSAVATLAVVCTGAGVSTPASQTTQVGAPAVFSVVGSGSLPTYQWQVSTDGGSTFANITDATGAAYTTNSVPAEANGNQFRCVVSVGCNSSSSTSAVAVLTVKTGDETSFRSAASGNWSDSTTWQWSFNSGATWNNATTSPTDANSTNIVVRSPHVVTVTSGVSIDQTTVAAGSQITINSGVTVTVADTGTQLDVSGIVKSAGTVAGNAIVFESGGKYQHNWTSAVGTIPIATWSTGSTCEVIGYTSAGSWGAGQGLEQSFYNFTWNCPNQTSSIRLNGLLTNVSGNFSYTGSPSAGSLVLGTDVASAVSTLVVGGNFTVNNGAARLVVGGNAADSESLNIGGDFAILAGGRVDWFSSQLGVLRFTGSNSTFSVAGTFDGHDAEVYYAVAAGAKLTLQNKLVVGDDLRYRTIQVDGTLDLNGKASSSFCALTGAATGVITNSSSALTLSLGAAVGGTESFNGVIAGPISLVKTGANTITFAGPAVNTYSGSNSIVGGVLSVQKDGGLGKGDVSVASGAILQLTAGVANNYFADTATLSLVAGSVVDLSYTGTPDTIKALIVDGVPQTDGIWGSVASGAANPSDLFTGTGTLNVNGAVVVSQPPVISQTKVVAGNIIISGSGTTNGSYYVLTATNITLPLSNWTSVATNPIDGAGQFSFTNAIAPGVPKLFYRMQTP